VTDVQKFSDLDLIAPIARAVADEGYDTPTPIQASSIPHLLEGRDLLGSAQTGTGKTAAFALPILQGLANVTNRQKVIRTLVMTPTRELAAQIGESFETYGKHLRLTSTVIFGGVSQHKQERALRRGVDILVATPGRLLDLMQQNIISLKHLEYFVLDEADRMLDMGFIHDVRRVIDALPEKRQSLFFSATMPPAVAKLADRLLTNPIRVEVAPQSTTAERVEQSILFVDKNDKRRLLHTLLEDADICRALVFSRTKHGADRIVKTLARQDIAAEAIHGNKSQNTRTRALDGFRSGRLRVLVATDIAARGIDVDDISHVINFDLPNEPESYVHRIGRTARAGRDGKAISFCAGDELEYLREIERIIKQPVPVEMDHAYHSDDAANGLVDGQRVENPAKQAQKRAMKWRAENPRPARRKPQRQNAKPAGSGSSQPKKQPKIAAQASGSTKTRRRRRRRPTRA
jgi:ATP-dependent RNA helicase RhlE